MALLTKADARGEAEPNTFNLPRGDALRRELVKVFRRQRQAVLRFARTGRKSAAPALETKQEPADPPAEFPSLYDFGMGALSVAERMTPLLRATWEEAAGKFAPTVGLDPDAWSVVDANTERMIRDAALAFSGKMNATTSLALDEAMKRTREALTAGVVDRGESLDLLTKRINAVFDQAETWRARRIAQTETARAVHAAQEQTAIRSGVVRGWKWLLSEDACPLCQTIARRAPAVRLGQPFAVVGDDPHYSTIKFPPLHPHCNCTTEAVLDVDDQPAWSPTLHQPKPEPEDLPEPPKPKPTPEPKPTKPKPIPKPTEPPIPAPEPEPPSPAPEPAPKPEPALDEPETPGPRKRPPPPKAPPKPAREPRPVGTPVGDALKPSAKLTPIVAANVKGAVESIAAVHGDGALKPIPVQPYKGEIGILGEFWRNNGVAMKIKISAAGSHQRLTTAHEIGHFLEWSAIPKTIPSAVGGKPFQAQTVERRWETDPLTKPWLDAMRSTKAYQRNSAIAGQKAVVLKRPDGSTTRYIVDKKYANYLNSPEECFARAYAQYIALRSDDPAMRAELDAGRKSDPLWAQQWADDDFEPIAREFDSLFAKLGWRK